MTAAASAKGALWNACREKTCCRSSRVHVTGADLARLVTAFELAAGAMVTAVEVDAGEPSGFRLRPGGPVAELVLRKNGPIQPSGAPCVFLVETEDRHAICGAGDAKPTSCQAFPAVTGPNGVTVLPGVCPCRTWLMSDVGEPERRWADAAAAEEAEDVAAIQEWNARVDADGASRTLDDFCGHLIDSPTSAA